MEKRPQRKNTRLEKYDYNRTGVFFLTICTKDRQCLLSKVVGTGVPDGPRDGIQENVGINGAYNKTHIKLTEHGKIADKYINQLNDFYNDISVKQYVIIPNHIHILLFVRGGGPSRTPVPTVQNSVVSRFISTFKRFCNKEYGENIWQYRSYDHIIRSREDYEEHVKYIYENPIRWQFDEMYLQE